MKSSKIFEVYEDDRKRLFTLNLTPGKKVYDERLVKEKGVEYRSWDAKKSKLAAMILKGCQNIFIRKNDVVLYLGAASGTTVSHVSDVVGKDGFIFALDFAPRVVRELVFVSLDRGNIAPILADANKPESFVDRVSQVDVIYQDIAQKNQLEIFLKNVNLFLKKAGYALLAVKARSIDVARKPKAIFNEIKEKLKKEIAIIDYRTLEPYELDHCMFVCKKK
jgi:fibrillarin-like pre-rRNA processing protein